MRRSSTVRTQIAMRQMVVLVVGFLLIVVVLRSQVDDLGSIVPLLLGIAGAMLGGMWLASSLAARELGEVADAPAQHDAARSVVSDRGIESIHDVERRLARVIDELRGETALREQILASMREGVILAGASGDTIYFNQAAEEMFGSSVRELLPPQLEQPGEHEFAVHHPIRRDLRATSVQVTDGRTLAVIQDETERKRVESIRRDFVANASHELKTPVAAIMVTAETVQSALDEDPDGARRFAGNLVREASRLSALVQDLLDLARLERGKAERSLVDLGDAIRSEVDHQRGRAEAKGLAMELDLQEPAEVVGVHEDVSLMIRNLVDNAVAYTNDGAVTVSGSRKGDIYEIAVADTGMGIPTADLERVFERFYRVDKARSRDTGGTGLGLSIVRHVAESMGGEVRVVSELGRGSRFTVRLPAI